MTSENYFCWWLATANCDSPSLPFWITQFSSAPGEGEEYSFGNKTFSPLNVLLLCLLWEETHYLVFFKSLRTHSKNLKTQKRNTPASHESHLSCELFRAAVEGPCMVPSRTVPDFFQLLRNKMSLVTVSLKPSKQIIPPYPWIKTRMQEAFSLSHSAALMQKEHKPLVHSSNVALSHSPPKCLLQSKGLLPSHPCLPVVIWERQEQKKWWMLSITLLQ